MRVILKLRTINFNSLWKSEQETMMLNATRHYGNIHNIILFYLGKEQNIYADRIDMMI
jgi:hypothetical protein